jgi:hypothetical protein
MTVSILFLKSELKTHNSDMKMKSNKKTIDENEEKLKYQTKQEELNGTIENLRLKKSKQEKIEKLRESKMKTKDELQENVKEEVKNFLTKRMNNQG